MEAQDYIDKYGSAEAALAVALDELKATHQQLAVAKAHLGVVQKFATRTALDAVWAGWTVKEM